MSIARVILVCGVLMACGASASAQDSVRLRERISTDSLDAISLGDVATIDGPAACTLAEVAIPPAAWSRAADGAHTLDIAALRRLLGDTKGINLGRLALSGARVEWREQVAEPPPAPLPAPEAAADAPPGLRVRDLLHDRLATVLSAAPGDLRITLDEGDADILNTPVEGRSVTITPMGESDRPPLAIRVYEGDKLIAARSTRVGVMLRRRIVLAARDIRRGELLDPSLLIAEERWLAPSVAAISFEDAAGKSARSAIEAGAILTRRDAEEPIVVRKGERIVIDCMVNGVLVRNTMRASEQARIGDVIAVEPLVAERSSRRGDAIQRPGTVFARFSGPGKGVVTTSEPTRRGSEPGELLDRINQRSQHAAPTNPQAPTTAPPVAPAAASLGAPPPFTIRRGSVEVTRLEPHAPSQPRKDQP
jgi:flagella basal body P-ring formation protein FlgA